MLYFLYHAYSHLDIIELFRHHSDTSAGLQPFKEQFKEVLLKDIEAIARFLSSMEEITDTIPIIQQGTDVQEVYQWAAGNFLLAFILGIQYDYDDNWGSQDRNRKWAKMVSQYGIFHVRGPGLTTIPLNEDLREAGRLDGSPATGDPRINSGDYAP